MSQKWLWVFVLVFWLSVAGGILFVSRRAQRLNDGIVAGTNIACVADEEAITNYRALYREWATQRTLAEKSPVTTREYKLARLRQYLAWRYALAAFSRLNPVEQILVEKLPTFQPTPDNRLRLATLEKEYRESLEARGIKFLVDYPAATNLPQDRLQ